MRFVTALFFWLLTTAALAVAVPVVWAQMTIVNEDGYAALSASAANDARLQEAMAGELTTQLVSLGDDNGYSLNPVLVRQVAASYTGNDGFAGQFAQANRIAHRWMFTGAVPSGNSTDEWLIDVAPMLSDPSFQATLGSLDLEVPPALTVPITVDSPELQPGKLRWLATWGPWASAAVVAVVAVCALLTVVAARSRGKALAALGVSALLVGAAGWAGIEVGRGYVEDALNRTTGDIHTVAEVMVAHAEGSLHHWLNITLVAGVVLVVLGAIAAGLGGLRRE
ncbi:MULTISPECIES: hypothetical protein [Mycobacteriaceae]|uniref:Uncharacterized protein n=1 Tax=Mycolicibacterium parafortuitum TaxID=39692 RepID=A0ACC6MI03_MYCPF|nr:MULTISPECIES: hypothetical protein [Mycobacteriaceae]MDZ5086625.1 hypothetical protein [Mycolicibacterium parafortuitum]GFM20708.1 uncharacterized protein PO1_contig-087-12 [Mycobacterium sp. PO1]GFM26002.1 uncharacterized protein PO2_contig-081-46 [Mycobacterium sp. PO2]